MSEARLYRPAGSVHRPLRHQRAAGGEARVHAVLYPFLEHTPQDTANNVLFRYVQYHGSLGYSRFYQYTQVRMAAPAAAPVQGADADDDTQQQLVRPLSKVPLSRAPDRNDEPAGPDMQSARRCQSPTLRSMSSVL